MKIHILKKGETLYEVSQKYKISMDQLVNTNRHIENPDKVMAGTKVKIPSPALTAMSAPSVEVAHEHKVQQGDTLWKLGKAWGVPLKDMIDANPQLVNPNMLMIGEIIHIPKVKSSQAESGMGHAPENQTSGNVKLPTNKKSTEVKKEVKPEAKPEVKKENTSDVKEPHKMFEMPEIPKLPNILKKKIQKLPEHANAVENVKEKGKEKDVTKENKEVENVNHNIEKNKENTPPHVSPVKNEQSPATSKTHEMPIYQSYTPLYAAQSEVNMMYPGIMAEHADPNMPAQTGGVNPDYYQPYVEENKQYNANMMHVSPYGGGGNSAFKPQWEAGMMTPGNAPFGGQPYYANPGSGHMSPVHMAGEPVVFPASSNSSYPGSPVDSSNMPMSAKNAPYVPMTSPYANAPALPYINVPSAPYTSSPAFFLPVFYPSGYPQPYGYRTEFNQFSPWMEEEIHAPAPVTASTLASTSGSEALTGGEQPLSLFEEEGTAKAKVSNQSRSSAKKMNERKTGNQRKRSTKPKRKNPWIKG